MAENFRLQTPENVVVSYDLAGVGSRFIAAATDSLIQIVLILLVVLAMAVAGGLATSNHALRGLSGDDPVQFGVWVVALLLLALFLLLWGYYAAFEMLWNGQTPGKRLVRLRVLRESGYPTGPIESLIRNLVRIVDYLPTSYMLGVTAILLTRRAQRLGDLAAGTIVVKERRVGSPRTLAALPPEQALPPQQAVLFTRDDVALARDFLLRRHELPPDRRGALAGEIAGRFRARLGEPGDVAATPEGDEWLLARVAAVRR